MTENANSTIDNLFASTPGETNTLSTETEGQEAHIEQQNPNEVSIETLQKIVKDTQRGFTKARQEIGALKTAVKTLEEMLASRGVEIPPEVQAELDALKHSDPEAWRQKLNHLERENAKSIKSKTAQAIEEQRRRDLLEEWNADNPDAQINEYVFNNVLPAGLGNQLREGKISFESFLKQAGDFLRTTKVGPGNSSKAGKKDPMTSSKGLDIDISKQDELPDYKDCIF